MNCSCICRSRFLDRLGKPYPNRASAIPSYGCSPAVHASKSKSLRLVRDDLLAAVEAKLASDEINNLI
jgi:hypothetical protein